MSAWKLSNNITQKKIPYQEGFSYGLRLPALETLQQWLHLRLKGLILLELVTLPDATTMRSLAPPALRNHEMPKHNQPSQLHAGSKLCSIFGVVFHLFLHHYFRMFCCISLKPRTTYCNLKPYVIVCHCSFHPCRLLAIQMILGQLSAAWCPANPLMTFSSAQSCLDFAKALNTTSKGSNSRMQVETC